MTTTSLAEQIAIATRANMRANRAVEELQEVDGDDRAYIRAYRRWAVSGQVLTALRAQS